MLQIFANNEQRDVNFCTYILLPKTTAARNEITHSYYRMYVLYFLAVVFAATMSPLVSLNEGRMSFMSLCNIYML